MAISANLNRVVGGLGLVVPIPRVVQQPVFFTIVGHCNVGEQAIICRWLEPRGSAAFKDCYMHADLAILTCNSLAAVLVTPSHPPCPTDFVCRTREQNARLKLCPV